MRWADTHAHLYAEEFNEDRDKMIFRALEKDINMLCLPNIDEDSIGPLEELVKAYPGNCLPMMGLHPCYVKENYQAQLDIIKQKLFSGTYCAVGEIGLDLYWDKTSIDRQRQALTTQLHWAHELNLPVSLHTREATEETLELIAGLNLSGLKGVFHCFSGTTEQARRAVYMGFHLGIGGVVTFKNSDLGKVLQSIPLHHLVLETDAPYLAPAPHRGKRNESSYIPLIGQKLAEVYQVPIEEIARITTENALGLFKR